MADEQANNYILGISGSPRKGGNSEVLMKKILEGAQNMGCETRRIYLRQYHFSSCIGCEKCRKAEKCVGLMDGMQILYPEIVRAKGVVWVSPTHHYNVTAIMKAFIDRHYCFYTFTNDRPRGWESRLAGQKRFAVIGAICEQPTKEDMGFTMDAMRLPLEALGYQVLGQLPVINIFDRGKVKEYNDIMTQAKTLGETIAKQVMK